MRSQKKLLKFEVYEQVLKLLGLEREWDVRKAQIGAAAEGRLDRFEDAAWEYARLDEAMIRSQVAELRVDLRNCHVVEIDDSLEPEGVQIGTWVRLKILREGVEETYLISGTSGEERISIFTPLAKTLIGAKEGQRVKFETPSFTTEYEVLTISWGVKPYLKAYLPKFLAKEIPSLLEINSKGLSELESLVHTESKSASVRVENLRQRAYLFNIINKIEYAILTADQYGISIEDRYKAMLEMLTNNLEQAGIRYQSLLDSTYVQAAMRS